MRVERTDQQEYTGQSSKEERTAQTVPKSCKDTHPRPPGISRRVLTIIGIWGHHLRRLGKNHPKGLEGTVSSITQSWEYCLFPSARLEKFKIRRRWLKCAEGSCLCYWDLLALYWVLLQTCLTSIKRKTQKTTLFPHCPRTKFTRIYKDTKISTATQSKVHNVWHPIKNYQVSKEARKYVP